MHRVQDKHASIFYRLAALEARASKRLNWTQTLYLPFIFFSYGLLLGTAYFQQHVPLLVMSGFCVYSVASAIFMFPILFHYYSRALEVSCMYNNFILCILYNGTFDCEPFWDPRSIRCPDFKGEVLCIVITLYRVS